ncbi:glycosyltransferase [Aquibacillus sediminis]|uniref:glycosyltransferase n=1 Tax=Aquibacillus sediminis TaxID=2574734 RepID=UPI001107C1FC|nr:glycosyltransferase [Aquibacillus sediminis]
MRILIVKLSPIEINDSANIRTLGLVKGLIGLNHSVDYLTIPTSIKHVKTIDPMGLGLENIIRTHNNTAYNTVISSEGKIKKKIVGILRNVYHAFSLYDYTHSIAKKIDLSLLNNAEYDLVISSSDPKSSHLAVQNLIKQGLKCKKWIQYWGDPLALDITNKSVYPQWFILNKEKKLLSVADKVVYVSPFTLTEQRKLFADLNEKMCFLPIPYIEEKIYGETDNNKFTIGYFGAYHSNVRDILPLYSACLKIKRDINLNIVGDSDVNLEQSESIRVYPRGDISDFERNADLLVCLLNKRGTQIPGKIYHAAATDKPVLVILDGDNLEQTRDYLSNFNRFILCENNKESISNALIEIIDKGEKYRPAQQFNPETIARNFIQNLNKE